MRDLNTDLVQQLAQHRRARPSSERTSALQGELPFAKILPANDDQGGAKKPDDEKKKTKKKGSSAEVGKQFHAALRLGGGWSPSARNRLIPSSLRMGLTVMNRSLRRSWS